MTSNASRPSEAFVWIWLPGKTRPVVAGRIYPESDHFVFTYGRSYLARDDAIPIYAPELPLGLPSHDKSGWQWIIRSAVVRAADRPGTRSDGLSTHWSGGFVHAT